MFQSRTGLLILFLSAATFIWGIPENKYELWGYKKSNKNVRKIPASRTMNLELCKFVRVHLTHFRLVQRQSATVTAHMRTIVTQSLLKPQEKNTARILLRVFPTECTKTIESSTWLRTGLLKRWPEQESQLFGINGHKRDVFNWNQ